MRAIFRPKNVLSLIIIPFFALLANAGELIGEKTIPPQRTATLTFKDFPEKGGAFWRIRPLDGQDSNAIEWISERKGPTARFIAPYGRYEVSCTVGVVTESGALDLDIAEAIITFGDGPAPGPAPGPTPPPNPAPVPTAELQALVGPIKAIMASADASKATIWANAWSDYATALKSAPPLSTKAEFKRATTTFLNSVATSRQLTNAFPGFSAAMETAFTTYFGAEDGALDQTKAQAFAEAIAWACRR